MNIKILLIVISLIVSAFADTSFSNKLNYFGNISASKLDSKGFDLNSYRHDSVNENLSLSPHSKVGAQWSYYNDVITFTAQALLKSNHNDYELDVTWLNFKYDLNDNYAIRLGRIQTKVFLYSASLDIDYLQLWAKEPSEVYRLMPIRTFNGLEITYNKVFNDYHFQTSLVTLASNKDTYVNGTKNTESNLDVYNSSSLSLLFENATYTYKASYSRSKANINDDAATIAIANGLAAYGYDVSRYTFEDRLIQVTSLGFQYRGDTFLFESEIAYSHSDGLLPSSLGAYAILGYKMNKFIPFVMYAENKNDKDYYNTSDIQVVDATSQSLKTALDDTLYVHNFSQKTLSLGFKYNIDIGMALKVQVDRITSIDYGSISSATVQSIGYESVGSLSRDAGITDKAIYAFTMGLSFAF
ncbi:hypothetical protein JHD48_07380 [Sulfurimonas sp. SAG-AH-194-I05]|nr:hypothetical protein [Sulfurimonas sp. SAG-AH-194-I05]MDF1875552.1 hypothetical protein [Sulfurimonas sp. SAG-AH-194-I05]